MSLTTSAWRWATSSPQERAEMIRRHAGGTRPLPVANLCELFDLTEFGLMRVMAGEDWKPEFERPAVNYIEG